MQYSEPFRWCFIGTGSLAQKIAGQLLASGRHKVVSCYTRQFENALSFASAFHCKAYKTAEAAMQDEQVDGVYIVTPHNAHARFVKLALNLKKAVLCEKPFTVSAKDTDELIDLARHQGTYLAEGMWTWFGPAANQVKSWIDTDTIGTILTADMSYCSKVTAFDRRTDPRRAGGALLDICIYPITYAYRLWGYPISVRANGLLSNGIDQEEQIELKYASGLTCRIFSSFLSGPVETIEITGTRGSIRVPRAHGSSFAYCTVSKNEQVFQADGPEYGNYLYEFDTVAQEIRSGLTESRMVPLQATSDVMHLLDEIRLQLGLSYDNLE